jgi:hypothetical protein
MPYRLHIAKVCNTGSCELTCNAAAAVHCSRPWLSCSMLHTCRLQLSAHAQAPYASILVRAAAAGVPSQLLPLLTPLCRWASPTPPAPGCPLGCPQADVSARAWGPGCTSLKQQQQQARLQLVRARETRKAGPPYRAGQLCYSRSEAQLPKKCKTKLQVCPMTDDAEWSFAELTGVPHTSQLSI